MQQVELFRSFERDASILFFCTPPVDFDGVLFM